MALLLAVLVGAITGCAPHAGDEEVGEAEAAWKGRKTFGLNLVEPRNLDFDNAYWMGRLAAMAYESRADVVRQLADVGVVGAEVIFFENAITDTQAVYIGLGNVGILAFRGTEPLSFNDWLTDIMAKRVDTPLGDLHFGFHQAFLSVWRDTSNVTANGKPAEGIARHLRERHAKGPDGIAPKPLFVTGHSLGGALGTIASAYAYWDACLQEKPEKDPFWKNRSGTLGFAECESRGIEVTSLFTFGAPRVGGTGFRLMSKLTGAPWPGIFTSLFRFVHANDLVTAVPDEGFIHACVGNERDGLIYLTKAGDIDVGAKSPEFLGDTWRGSLLDSVGDHGMAHYNSKLLAHAGRSRRLLAYRP